MSNINSIVTKILNNCDYDLNKIDDIQAIQNEVKDEYIKEVRNNSPEKNALQSWRTKSGEFLEIFVVKFLDDTIENSELEVNREVNLPKEVINNLKLNFQGEKKLPDIDVVIHANNKPLLVLSCKTTPRERVSQTLFWKYAVDDKLLNPPRFYFVTMDKDKELKKSQKWRIIMGDIIDCCYVINEKDYSFGESFKHFSDITEDISNINYK